MIQGADIGPVSYVVNAGDFTPVTPAIVLEIRWRHLSRYSR